MLDKLFYGIARERRFQGLFELNIPQQGQFAHCFVESAKRILAGVRNESRSFRSNDVPRHKAVVFESIQHANGLPLGVGVSSVRASARILSAES